MLYYAYVYTKSKMIRTFVNSSSVDCWWRICCCNGVVDIAYILLQAIMHNDWTPAFDVAVVARLSTCETCNHLARPTDQVELHLRMHKRHAIACISCQNVVPARWVVTENECIMSCVVDLPWLLYLLYPGSFRGVYGSGAPSISHSNSSSVMTVGLVALHRGTKRLWLT